MPNYIISILYLLKNYLENKFIHVHTSCDNMNLYIGAVKTMKKYELVKQGIKQFIKAGHYQPNQKISSEAEMTDKFGVSRHTVRKAINDLVNEGWLYTEQGAGTFCADRSESKISPKPGSEKTIALVTTYISNYIFPKIIEGVESYLSSRGYTLLLYSTNNDLQKERQCLENILEREISGLIVEPTKSNFYNPNFKYYLKFESENIPYLMLNATYPELTPPNITLDDEGGAFLLTEHLIQLGHTRIVGLFKIDDRQGARRMQGYIRAHREYDIALNPNRMLAATKDEWENTLSVEFKNLFTESASPTAIVCYNDEVAIEVLDVLRELELNVPGDVSIVGFDDSNLATASEVKLTTIRHPQFEMGRLAGEKMVQLIEQKDKVETLEVQFEPLLIVRHSTEKINQCPKTLMI